MENSWPSFFVWRKIYFYNASKYDIIKYKEIKNKIKIPYALIKRPDKRQEN